MNLSAMFRCLLCTFFVCVTLGIYVLPATTTQAAITVAPPQPEYEYFKTFTGFGRTSYDAAIAAGNQMRSFERSQNVSCVVDDSAVGRNPLDPSWFVARLDARCSTS